MLETLKRVRGAVSTKDLIPALTHFCIYDGRVQGANGRVAIDSAAPDVKGMSSFIVPAEKFMRAIDACGDTEPALVFKDNKLTVRAGKFRATMQTLPENDYPRSKRFEDDPAASSHRFNLRPSEGFLGLLRTLLPFVSTDASRPWSQSILFKRGYAYASNNVIVARTQWVDLSDDFTDDFTLPLFAIEEMLRLDAVPKSMMVGENAIYAQYGDYWLRSQTLVDAWPNVQALFASRDNFTALEPVYLDMRSAVEGLKPFFPAKDCPVVLFDEKGISTQEGVSSANFEVGSYAKAAFRLEPLQLAMDHAMMFDIKTDANKAYFVGEEVEGFISKMRV